MIIECACKKYKFAVKAEEIGVNGRVVQCGVCDQKWFQEPASTEESKILKENILRNEEIKEEINNSKREKNITKKNYVPIKYKSKSKLNFNKILIVILIILIISLILFYENKEQIIIKYPNLLDIYNLLDEFIEYLKENYSDFIKILFPK
jgi:predicted Zn finger-like uncharacterized protein